MPVQINEEEFCAGVYSGPTNDALRGVYAEQPVACWGIAFLLATCWPPLFVKSLASFRSLASLGVGTFFCIEAMIIPPTTTTATTTTTTITTVCGNFPCGRINNKVQVCQVPGGAKAAKAKTLCVEGASCWRSRYFRKV